MICTVSRRVRVPKTLIPAEQVQKDLILRDTRGLEFGNRCDLVCYEERQDSYILPKAYGLKYIKDNLLRSKSIIPEGDPIHVSFQGSLREAQIPVVDAAIVALREEEGAVLNLYCGFGKTTCANMISCRLGLKTLVLVHTSALADQWKDRIEQFVNGASVGFIRQKTFEVEGRTHVIGMIQSISKKTYPKGAFDSFGLTVIDECHHICADHFSKCIKIAGSKYRLGLSATPIRKDGFHPFMWYSIGKIASTVERTASTQELLVEAVLVTSGPTTVHMVHRAGGKKSVNMSRMISDLCTEESLERTLTLAGIIESKVRQGRHIIVLSDRREHLVEIASHLKTTTGFMVGGQRAAVSKAAEQCSVIMATYAFTSEGVDIPSLDTAIFATPRSDVVQTTGRILRKHDSKKTPLVVDFVDALQVFRKQFVKREGYYKSLGGVVTYMDTDMRDVSWAKKSKKEVNEEVKCLFSLAEA